MRIFAKFVEENGVLFRTKTIIQFGNSWELIGSIVMKNPGSAKPGIEISKEVGDEISKFYSEEIDLKNWYVSEGDKTIGRIAPIFNGSYLGKGIELNGIIQVYNLFNICEPKINIAFLEADKTNSECLFSDVEKMISEFNGRPVYLGFFDFYTNKKSRHYNYLQNSANRIFEYIKSTKHNYFSFDQIIDNPFYHPFSPQIKNDRSLNLLNKFFSFYEN